MSSFKEVFSAEVIERRVGELAAQIDDVYQGETVVAVSWIRNK